MSSWKKHASLGVSVKNRNDYADYDYLDKLSTKDLNWLMGFHREFVNADFQHKYTKIYKLKKEKRQIYTLNNIRNRDLYNTLKINNLLFLNEEVSSKRNLITITLENSLIIMFDHKHEKIKNKLLKDNKLKSFLSIKEASLYHNISEEKVKRIIREPTKNLKFYWDYENYE